MSARKAATKVVAKPARKGAPLAFAKRTSAKKITAAKSAAKPAASATDDASTTVKKLAAEVERALAQGQVDLLTEEAIQALMAAACRSYSARIEAGACFPPLADRSPVTSTDVMVTASGLLKSANLAVFELGMWQSWTGR